MLRGYGRFHRASSRGEADDRARSTGQRGDSPRCKRYSRSQSVARAAPDGYTLLVGQPGEVSINPLLMKDIGYDPDKDLQPVALAALSPLALVVQSKAPYSTISEMTAASLSSQRGLSFASPGLGTPGHVAVELLRRTKGRLNHVPFEGGPSPGCAHGRSG